jgi:SAM-dependent methyltransferase
MSRGTEGEARKQAVGRRVLDHLRTAFPSVYWRARNAVALVELYAQRLRQPQSGADAYGEDFWTFHDTGDWDGFARTVLAHAPAQSIVDVGCGHGLTLAGFARVDPALVLRGFDESPAALRRARARGLPVEPLDVLGLSATRTTTIAGECASFDLGICLEVAEHLPSWHSDTLLAIVSAPKRLVFSAAHPNQGGRFHVNEQPARYWIERLAARGMKVSAADAAFRNAIAALDLPPWYGENVHLFERAR